MCSPLWLLISDYDKESDGLPESSAVKAENEGNVYNLSLTRVK